MTELHIKPNKTNNLQILPNRVISLCFNITKLQEAKTMKEECAIRAKFNLKNQI